MKERLSIRRRGWIFGLAVLTAAAAGPRMVASDDGDRPPLRTDAPVDLNRYFGQWYVIANIPYFVERGNVDARVVYRERDDGRIDDLYFYREEFGADEESLEGVAWVVEDTGNARWKVRFYWPLTFDYAILDVDDGYRHAAVGHPSREYGWVLAREPRIDDREYERLMRIFEANGYDRGDFLKVPQFEEQLGRPGFQ